MISFIRVTIRAWLAPEYRLSCSATFWRQIVGELRRRGDGRHEAGAFLLGHEQDGRRRISDVIYYDDLDQAAYDSGVCILHGDAFAALWSACRARQLTVVADVHTHPGAGFQSWSDRTNPMIARAGHIALILPCFGHWPVAPSHFGIYEYPGDHNWFDRSPPRNPGFFYTGMWS